MLKTDRQTITADGRDVAVVTVEVQDAKGRLVPDACPDADLPSGGRRAHPGCGQRRPQLSGCRPSEGAGLQEFSIPAFNGLAQVLVQSSLDHDRQIGQTGVTVHPKVYIACGISGQIQHIAGMQDSGIIISINSDPDAPINRIADYVIVGTVEEVVPKLIKYYKQNSK